MHYQVSVLIPATVTHLQFGEKKEIYDRDIKGKFLPVVGTIGPKGKFLLLKAEGSELPYPVWANELINWQNQ